MTLLGNYNNGLMLHLLRVSTKELYIYESGVRLSGCMMIQVS